MIHIHYSSQQKLITPYSLGITLGLDQVSNSHENNVQQACYRAGKADPDCIVVHDVDRGEGMSPDRRPAGEYHGKVSAYEHTHALEEQLFDPSF